MDASARQPVDPALFTVVVTSCGRFDLLDRMLASFNARFATERILVAEDSSDHHGARACAARHANVELLINDPKLGQMRSIDRLYAQVATPYVIHLEDDWEFTRAVDPARILAFLEANEDIACALLAPRDYASQYEAGVSRRSGDGLSYKTFALDTHPAWFSYSFNPSIARRGLWREIGPFTKFGTEEKLSRFLKERGMTIAMLDPPIGRHSGDRRHVPDPFQPQRPRTILQKLARSVGKRWTALVKQG